MSLRQPTSAHRENANRLSELAHQSRERVYAKPAMTAIADFDEAF